MKRQTELFRPAAWALLVLLTASATTAPAADPIKINGPLVAGGNVSFGGLQFSPDSSRVLYAADQDTNDVTEIYSVASGGGTPTKLNGLLVAGGDVFSLQFSPDSGRVLYRADQDTDNVTEIYSVASGGGTATKLNGPLVANGRVVFQQFSPDSSRVLYLADQDTDEVDEIYSVPSAGGTPTKLNGPLVAGGDTVFFDGLQFSPDSSRVLYLADQDTDFVNEIYSVPSGGGTPTKLNGPLVGGGGVFSAYLQFSPDGSRVLYIADQGTDEVSEIYSVPSAGGPATKLNGPLVAEGDVMFTQFSPDSSRVLYLADQDTDFVNEIYSVPSAGGPATKLNGPLTLGGDVFVNSLQFSPDSSRVLYLASQESFGVNEIYSVPSAGGPATKLNGPLVAGGNVISSQFSPDSSRVLYLADQDTENVNEIYLVPSTGGTPVKLNGPLGVNRDVLATSLQFSPDGSKVLYLADQDVNGVVEAYIRIVRDRAKPGMTGNWDTAGAWDQSVVPDEVIQVFIDGFSTINATGNAAPRTVNELTVGGAGLTGVLLLDSGAEIAALHGITIGASGLISGDGQLDADVVVQSSGALTTGAGQQLRIVGHELTIAGGAAVTDNGDGIAVDGGAVSIINGQFHKGGVLRVEAGAFNSANSVDFGGISAARPATFEFVNGTDAVTPFAWRIGNDAGTFGATTVSGVNGGVRTQLRGSGGGGGADLFVGNNGTGTLTVADGALADFGDDFILGLGLTGNGTAIVTGTNGGFRSTVDVTANGTSALMIVGSNGAGDLTIANGGLVSASGDSYLGQVVGGSGVLTIGGSSGGFDATLDIAGGMGVGGTLAAAGGSAVLTLNNGGVLDVAGDIHIWPGATVNVNAGVQWTIQADVTQEDGSTFNFEGGTITIDGGVASLGTALFFGGTSQANQPTLVLQNGATATGFGSTLGGSPGDFAALIVSGASATQPTSLALSSGATIAFRGTAQLEVLDGGRVDITGPLVAGSSTGGDGSITVSGVNGALRSTIDATGDIRLALSSLGSMSIGAGALVHAAGNVSVAEFSTSNGTITIGGAAGGSSAELSADGDLFVGGGPNGNGGAGVVNINADGLLSTAAVTVFTAGQLNVAGGGFASTGNATINGGAVTVSGADGAGNVSTWNSSATISVGTNATGSLNVTAGGHLTSVSGVLGSISSGNGSAAVSGTDGSGNASKWTIDSALHVGLQGTGVLEILAGGEVQSTTASMGAGSNSIGIVTVSGAGSTWTNTGNLQVGRGGAGDTATLTIQDQARVEIGGELDVFQTATVSLAGGTLIADMIDRSITSSFNFTGGRLQVANYIGNLTNNGGTLGPGSSPGTTNFIGNYTQASGTLEIELGGTTAGSQFDVLTVSGTATLGGELDVPLINGFENSIASSDQFVIVDAGSLSGAFTNVAPGTRIAVAEAGGHIRVNYGATSPFSPNQVVLSHFATGNLVATWVDGISNWTTATNWDIGEVPNTSAALYDAIVPTGTATVDAPIEVRALTVSAGGAVQVDNDLTVTQDAQFTGGAVDVAAGAALTLGGNVLFHGGASYTGDGVISPTGATVSFENGQTNIFVGQFNIGEAAHTIIGQNDAVALNVDQIDDDNTIDGIITINRGGTLNIGQSTRSFWQTSAISTINFENQAPASSLNQIAGPATVLQGTVNVNGGLVRMRSNTTLRADPNFVPGNGVDRATVNMNPQGILRFDNIANIENALITGGGTLRFLQEGVQVATISANVDIDVDNFETVQNGTVGIQGASVRVDTVSLDSGSLTLDAAARFVVSSVGTAPAAGLFVGLPGGTGNVSISGGAALNAVDTTIADGGSVVILNGSLSSTGGIELQGGQLSGSGVVVADINNTGGTVAPGNSPGVLSQTGDFTHSLGGTLAIEIGGTTLGTEYDQLAITGSASLSGMLDVALLDLGGGPFAPTLGNLFTILTATGGVTGTFATMAGDLPALTGGNEWAINYNATDVVLEIVVAGLDGDYNGDSMVDAADYTVWRDNLGAPDETALNGNGDGLNGVDAADYSLWATSFGSTLASSAGVAGSIGVPEPTAAWMMLIGWMMLARRRTLLAEWTRPY